MLVGALPTRAPHEEWDISELGVAQGWSYLHSVSQSSQECRCEVRTEQNSCCRRKGVGMGGGQEQGRLTKGFITASRGHHTNASLGTTSPSSQSLFLLNSFWSAFNTVNYLCNLCQPKYAFMLLSLYTAQHIHAVIPKKGKHSTNQVLWERRDHVHLTFLSSSTGNFHWKNTQWHGKATQPFWEPQ